MKQSSETVNFQSRSPGRFVGAAPFLACLGGMFLLVLGLRWLLIADYASQVPFWDQWISEAPVLSAWARGELGWAQLWAPVNEHRLLLMKLWAIVALSLNGGQWDSQPYLALNALWAAAVPVLVLALLGRARPGEEELAGASPWRPDFAMLGLLAALWCSPLLYYNALWAFQSQFYFLTLFSLAGMALLTRSRPGGLSWFLGLVCCLGAIFSMGSGFLAAAAVAGALLLRFWRRSALQKRDFWTIGVCVALVVAAFLMQPAPPLDTPSRAANAAEFVTALSKQLSWPWTFEDPMLTLLPMVLGLLPNEFWPAILLWLPAPVLLLLGLFRRDFTTRLCIREHELDLLNALTLWVHAQILLLAIMRGADGRPPALRYYDVHVLGAAANGFALLVLVSGGFAWIRHPRLPARVRRVGPPVLLTLFGLGILGGVFVQYEHAQRDLAKRPGFQAEQVKNLRAYLATGDPRALIDKPLYHIPFAGAELLAARLQDPAIRAMLPPSLQVRGPENPPPRYGALTQAYRQVRPAAYVCICAGLAALTYGLWAPFRRETAVSTPTAP